MHALSTEGLATDYINLHGLKCKFLGADCGAYEGAFLRRTLHGSVYQLD